MKGGCALGTGLCFFIYSKPASLRATGLRSKYIYKNRGTTVLSFYRFTEHLLCARCRGNSENETNKMPLLLELLFFLEETENEHISAQIYPICILHTLLLQAQKRESMLSIFKIHSMGDEVGQWKFFRRIILGFLQIKDI